MDQYLENILLYSHHYLEEYKSILENNYKNLLDEVKRNKKLDKTFKLYKLDKLIPYAFMYDYGTWIFWVTLSKPKCLIKLGDKRFNRDWAQIYNQIERRKEILEQLQITDEDILDMVIVEGCPFLTDKNEEDIEGTAVEHARYDARRDIDRYSFKKSQKKIPFKEVLSISFVRKNLVYGLILIIVFFVGYFLGNYDRLKYIKKINLLGFEIEFSEKLFEKK